MNEIPYDAASIAGYFDEYGERERERFEGRPMDLVNLELHREKTAAVEASIEDRALLDVVDLPQFRLDSGTHILAAVEKG